MIKIENEFPMPEKKTFSGPKPDYAWHDMKPGVSSFFIETGEKARSRRTSMLNSFRVRAKDLYDAGHRLVFQEHEREGKKGLRVWVGTVDKA